MRPDSSNIEIVDDLHVSLAYRNSVTLVAYYAMNALVLVAVGVFMWRGNFESALSAGIIFLIMFIPSILKERYRLYLPFAIELGIIAFMFSTLFLGEVARFYYYVPFWDKFTHFQSGLLLGASVYVLVYILNEHKKISLNLSPIFVSIFAVAFSLAIGAGWEIFEFMGDSIFGSRWQTDGTDTMWDMIADLVGALIISVIGYFWMHRHKRLPFTPWVLRILKGIEK